MNINHSFTAIAECRDPRLQGLKCAYTGKPLVVNVSVSARLGALYFAVGPSCKAYAGSSHKDLKSLLETLSQRDGITGAVDAKEALHCPYTGEDLIVTPRLGGLFTTKGGFNPYIPFTGGVDAFVQLAKSRNGVGLEKKIVEPEITIEEVAPPLEVDPLKEKYEEKAASMMETVGKALSNSTTVSVPSDKKSHHKGKGK